MERTWEWREGESSGIGGFGDEGNGATLGLGLGLVQLGLLLADLLHLEHALHDKLVLALLVGMALVLALPWKVELGLPALVERDEEVGALVPVWQGNPGLHHLLLRRYHLLR